MNSKTRIVVAGASGYIGKALLPVLLEKFPEAEITALARTPGSSDDPRIQWKACDLFSLKSLEEALPESIDLAIYLVHSMGPTAQLDQGSFADYDLILADNFARAIAKLNVHHLIYLGGLLPESGTLSLHLQSRLEVEETFEQYKLPTTFFRAGMILGEGGSSFQILLKLVHRLPIMVCPPWTLTLTTPVDLASVLRAIVGVALEPKEFGRIYDLAGCQPLSYLEMMRETAKRVGRHRLFLTVPIFTPTLSRLWVSMITNTSPDLVYPLIESLRHEMVARKSHLYSSEVAKRTYADLIKNSSINVVASPGGFRFRARRGTVRSVQRLSLPEGKDAVWVKRQYLEWLPRFLTPFVRVRSDGPQILFSAFWRTPVLLELGLSEPRSDPDRQLLYIIKGLLVADENRGRLEFRVVLNRRYVLAAIHDFAPSLPWFLYKQTQARVHLLVMRAFGRKLARTKSAISNPK